MKKTLLISSLVIIAILGAEAYRENLNGEWLKYQQRYKTELLRLAKTDQERATAENFDLRMRQIVLPDLNKIDRCVSCHVGMEDFRMSDMPNPLKSHPGDYLDVHDLNKVGCTLCHDGQGRAIVLEDAHALVEGKYWEKPILKKPFLEANCARCHANTVAQAPYYNKGRELFKARGCVACHKVDGAGGVTGPELTDIGNASFHVKAPIEENRDALLDKFHHNVNLAYMYEAITEPKAQPAETKMPDFILTEEEKTALLVYLKSLSAERRVMDVGLKAPAVLGAPKMAAMPAPVALSPGEAPVPASKGYNIFVTRCFACHTVGQGKRVGPDLKGVAARRDRKWLKKFIQTPSVVFNEKDPIALKLLAEYKTPMTDLGLTDKEVEEVIKFLENPVVPTRPAGTAAASGTAPAMGAASGERQPTGSDVAKGRDLFQGKMKFLNDGPSCISCHHVRNDNVIGGGTLAKDLTAVFSRLGGSIGIKAILGNPPFPVMNTAYKNNPLTEDEIFATIAFLEEADKEQAFQKSVDYGAQMLGGGIAGAFVLFGFYSLIWYRRKKNLANKSAFDNQTKYE